MIIKRLLNARKSPNELLCKYHCINISWHVILLTVLVVIGCTHMKMPKGDCAIFNKRLWIGESDH